MAKRYMSADEAAAALRVSKATLYSYVSRGLLRSEETGSQSRARRYLAEDVNKLKARKEYRRDPAQVAQDALHWGTPLLDSGLTLISEGGLYYRGQDAVTLAREARFEDVAALMWTGDGGRADELFTTVRETDAIVTQIDRRLMPTQRMTIALALVDDLAGYDLRPEAVARTGARILQLVVAALTMQAVGSLTLAEQVQQAWRPDAPEIGRLINAALILCADHELNVSSFTARVVASADATPYAVVTAGLAALSGTKHGGVSAQVEAFLREVGTQQQIEQVTAGRLRRGERIPGFGHSLYPDGDPRAKTLLELTGETYPDAVEMGFVLACAEKIERMIGQGMNIDFALAALARVAGLPAGSPLGMFALGRTVGWIGHAIEQYRSGALIRPRARYTGVMPGKRG